MEVSKFELTIGQVLFLGRKVSLLNSPFNFGSIYFSLQFSCKLNHNYSHRRLKRISSIVVKEDCKLAYIGTEGGNVYMLDIPKFEITDKIIYLDVVLQK